MKKLTQRQLMEQQIAFLKKNDPNSKELAELEEKLKRSKMGRRSKTKGASYERTIAKKFATAYPGLELTRTPQSGGFAKKSSKADDFRGDIVSVDKDIDLKLHIECKDHKSWSLPQWINQATEDCPKGKVPTVIFHKHGTSKDYVCLSLEDFFKLVDRDKIIERCSNEKKRRLIKRI